MIRELKKDIVALVAYLIGVSKHHLNHTYINNYPDLFTDYDNIREARIIRSLCKLRHALMNNYKKFDIELIENHKKISEIEFLAYDDICMLESWGIDAIQYNCRAYKHMQKFNELISLKIDDCAGLFPAWVEWSFIRDLFIMPKGYEDESIKAEFAKYIKNKRQYPYMIYINWTPHEYGNFLHNDRKFLKILYSQNGSYFYENSRVLDAGDEVKENIYDFVAENDSTVIVVDCENSDVYKLYAVIKNLNQEEIIKIEKIILYDDIHTTYAWQILSEFINIDVERIEVERIKDDKSLVDIRMTAGVCTEFYKNNIRSFILVSSDSDFWGLISSLPEAEFLVMIEYNKCGKDIKEAMRKSKIPYCSIDDFCTGNTDDLKNEVLFSELEYQISNISLPNGKELLEDIFLSSRVYANETEKKKFYEKHIRTLKLTVDLDGEIKINIR